QSKKIGGSPPVKLMFRIVRSSQVNGLTSIGDRAIQSANAEDGKGFKSNLHHIKIGTIWGESSTRASVIKETHDLVFRGHFVM
ncbi:10260_t:CDS:2, partial [Acaulospora colombiana]